MPYSFDKFKKDVKTYGGKAKDKAKDVADTTKLKMDIRGKRTELTKLYAALGQVYYAAHQHDENVPEEVMFTGIRKAEGELAQMEEQLTSRGEKLEEDEQETPDANAEEKKETL